MTQKIVINSCFGGFGMSDAAIRRYLEIKGIPFWVEHGGKFESILGPDYLLVPPESRQEPKEGHEWYKMPLEERKAYNERHSKEVFNEQEIKRDDPALVQVVKELGLAANGKHARLKVVEIPDDVHWVIEEYDGSETVEEDHRSWS